MKNILIKIGGSVITDKHSDSGSIDAENLQRIVNVIARLKTQDRRLIIIHGAGSYAHPYMAKTEKKRGMYSCDVDNIRESMSELSAIISGAFSNAGIENFTDTLPENFCGKPEEWQGLVSRWVGKSEHSVPLLHGNVVLCKGNVLKISGDELVEKIGSAWGKPLIVLVSKHPVCDKNPDFDGGAKVLSRITPGVFDSLKNEANQNTRRLEDLKTPYPDATGSMLGKLEYLVRLAGGGIESYIVNIEGFEKIFDNPEKVLGCGNGTRICR
ncbi:MAG: hypothetical protein MSIBF_04490 [Candidatus Altiarchaeales archaeon IMC4]|nr:MAG: hypothetical protein MSIBF_04490 [Candidatus Altiarchaeales archaeon IMC4]